MSFSELIDLGVNVTKHNEKRQDLADMTTINNIHQQFK